MCPNDLAVIARAKHVILNNKGEAFFLLFVVESLLKSPEQMHAKLALC